MMVEPIFDYQFRFILIGDSTVGKSSLLRYFTDGKFEEVCDPTVGVDFFARLIEIQDGIRVKLQLWDTAGQERFRSITKSYYRNSVGVLIVFDVTKRASFEHLDDWISEAKLHLEPYKGVYVIVGHKCDEEDRRAVTFREGYRFAERYGLRYIETSAVTGKNVEEAFSCVAREVYTLMDRGQLKVEEGWDGIKNGYARPRASFHLDEAEQDRGGCC